jgi:hypothetical protein
MGLNKSFDRTLVVIGGSVKTSGGSLRLAKGEFGIFNKNAAGATGIQAVSGFAGMDKKKNMYELRLGVADLPVTRSQTNKSFNSVPFSISDVEELTVNAPSETEQSVDELIVGYNGIDPNTTLSVAIGDSKKLFLELSGTPIGNLGYPNSTVTIEQYIVEPDVIGSTGDAVECLPHVLDLIERLRNHELRGGVKVSEFVDIMPIKSCDNEPSPSETLSNFWELTIPDTGDQNALSLVQAQYPDYKVVAESRTGAYTTYKIVVPAADPNPSDYSASAASLIKGCDTCPSGYTEAEGGYVFNVVVTQGETTDHHDLIEDKIAGVVEDSGVLNLVEMDNGGASYTAYYSFLASGITSAEEAAILGITEVDAVLVVENVGEVTAICDENTPTTTSWTNTGSCTVTTEQYTINLPDNDCGQDRLAELQDAFPALTIAVNTDIGQNKSVVITVTGSSGTANIAIDGTDYLVTFDTDLDTTAANFVTTHAEALATENVEVSVSTDELTFNYPAGFADLTITNATGNLAGSVGSATAGQVKGGCQTQYIASVPTNVVCPECDDIFLDYYTSEAPQGYEQREWVLVGDGMYSGATNCLCGIRIKGKTLEVMAGDDLRDELAFIDSSVKIQVDMGSMTEVREGIPDIRKIPFNSEYLSRWKPRNNMGGVFYDDEDRARMHFTGEQRYYGSGTGSIRRMFKGQETHLDPTKQYVDYAITIKRSSSAQSFSSTFNERTTYHILVEVGRHTAVENLLNSLATAAGLPTVQAYG